jgi:hypothetical protein
MTKTRAVLLAALLAARAGAQDNPWSVVDPVLKRAGVANSDGSWTVVLPRDDVEVASGPGMPTPWELGLHSFATFHGDAPDYSIVVGDTCMAAHEVQPVIDALRAHGLEIVALHNHMLTDEPRLFFLHFQGKGRALDLARGIRAAWDHLGKPKPETPALPPAKDAPEPDWTAVGSILKVRGKSPRAGIFKCTLPRHGLGVRAIDARPIGAGMGLACWAAFYACPCGRTKVMGDTCVLRGELQAAIDALRKGGVNVTAIHNHFLGTDPAVAFLHFEGEGDALALAYTIRACWDVLR